VDLKGKGSADITMLTVVIRAYRQTLRVAAAEKKIIILRFKKIKVHGPQKNWNFVVGIRTRSCAGKPRT
jgi:hypothetical protein